MNRSVRGHPPLPMTYAIQPLPRPFHYFPPYHIIEEIGKRHGTGHTVKIQTMPDSECLEALSGLEAHLATHQFDSELVSADIDDELGDVPVKSVVNILQVACKPSLLMPAAPLRAAWGSALTSSDQLVMPLEQLLRTFPRPAGAWAPRISESRGDRSGWTVHIYEQGRSVSLIEAEFVWPRGLLHENLLGLFEYLQAVGEVQVKPAYETS